MASTPGEPIEALAAQDSVAGPPIKEKSDAPGAVATAKSDHFSNRLGAALQQSGRLRRSRQG
jgi:hypothetical protein